MYQRSGLDRQIFDFKSKLPQDNEKKLRGLNFAKLQFMNKDYKNALRNINEYLSVKDQSASGYKLLGQIYEALDENPKALEAYKRSYHLDKKEMNLLPEICRLLVSTQADNESKRQWLAKAEKLFPYHEEVGKLRQSMLENREDSLSETLKDISNCSIQNIDLSSLNISSPAPVNLSAIVASPLKLETQIKSIARTQDQIIRRLVETQEALVQTNERLTAAIGENNELIQNVAKQVKELSDSVAQIHCTQKELKENFDAFTQGDAGDDDDDEEYSDDDNDYHHDENDHNQGHGGASPSKNASSSIFSRLGGFGQPSDNSKTQPTASSTGFFGNQFAPPSDSWECGVCYVQNMGKKDKCVACESPSPFQSSATSASVSTFGNPSNASAFKPQAPPAVAKPLSEMFKPVQGTWECQGCCLQNNPNVNICPSCETPKPGYQPPVAQQQPPKFTFGTLGQTVQPTQNQSTPQQQPEQQQQSKPFMPQPTQSFSQFIQQTPPAPAPNAFGSPATQSVPFSFNLTAQKALSPPNNPAPTPNANQTTPVKSTFSFGLPQQQQQQSPAAPAPFNAMMGKPAAPFTFGNFTSPGSVPAFGLSNPTAQATPPFGTPSSVAPSLFQSNPPSVVQTNEPNPLQMLQKQVENQPVVQTSATFVPPVVAKPPSAAPLNPSTFTGFSFNQNINSSPFAPKVESPAKPATSNQVFGFGSSGKFDFSFNPVTPTVNTSSKAENENKPDAKADGAESDGEVENNADDIHFQPVIPLPPKVEVRTGEEGEDVLFSHRARLFRYDNGDWKERGTGDIKVLYEPNANRYRLLMRREQIHKVCLNHQIMNDFTFFEKSANNRALKDLQWAATDFSDGEATPLVFTLRFKDSDIRNRFMDTVTSVVEKIKSGTSGQLDSKPNLHDQNSSLTQDDEVQVLFVKQPNEDLRAKARELRLPENFYNYESEPDCKGCPGCNDEMPTLKFEADGINVLQSIRQSDPSSVSAAGGDSELKPTSQPVFGTLFSGFNSTAAAPFSAAAGGNLFSAAIDEQGAKTGGWSLSNAGQNKWNTGKIQPIFGSTTSGNADSTANDDDPEAEANVEFKPIIPLPELVEVKTGEEDETVLFSNRAKLYRFDKNEWKERGVGDFRLLKNESTGRVRFLMRREQIHKVCLNHTLTKDLDIKLRDGSDRIFQWNAVDFSEGTGTPEVLALRFGNAELAKTLQNAIEKAKSEM